MVPQTLAAGGTRLAGTSREPVRDVRDVRDKVNLVKLIRPSEAEVAAARRRLHLKAATITAITLGAYWSLVFAPIGLVLRILSAAVLVLALTAVATSIMHDANHGAFSRSTRVNRLAGLTMDLLGGSSWLWRFKHNTLHHGNTNVVGVDRDLNLDPIARVAPQQQWHPWHRYQHLYLWFFYGFMTLRMFLIADLVALARSRNQAVSGRRRRRDVAILVGGKFVHVGWALVVPLLLHPWWAVLAFYLACSWFASLLLAVIFQLAHCVEDAEFLTPEADYRGRQFQLHQLRTTVDVRCSVPAVRPLVRFVMGGLDHQVVHHLAPSLPHTIYPMLAERLASECATRQLPYHCHPSITAALRAHLRWLKAMGAAPVQPVGGGRPAVP